MAEMQSIRPRTGLKPRAPKGGDTTSSVVDWTNRDHLRRWFADLSTSIDDEIAVAADQLAPLRTRKLGPAEAIRLHDDAVASIRALLASAEAGLAHGS